MDSISKIIVSNRYVGDVMNSKKKITYKPICWQCGSRRNLTKYHAQGGEYHLCKKHAPAWMKRTKRAESKKP